MNNTDIEALITDPVKVTQINFTLSEDNKLVNGMYRIPQCDLVPSKLWGHTVSTPLFTYSGSDIKVIK